MASTSGINTAAEKKTYADKMRQLALENRVDAETYRMKKQENDMLAFFESEVKKDAKKKIEKRAKQGFMSANILEYPFGSYFYVTSEGKVVRMDKFEERKGVYMHRIFKMVHTDEFQKLLKDFVASLGDMTYSCWFLGKNQDNVITVRWGDVQENAIAEGERHEVYLDLSQLKLNDTPNNDH